MDRGRDRRLVLIYFIHVYIAFGQRQGILSLKAYIVAGPPMGIATVVLPTNPELDPEGDSEALRHWKRPNGRGLLEGKKYCRRKTLRDEHYISLARSGKYKIMSQAVVEATIQARKSSAVDSIRNISHGDPIFSIQLPREAHELTSDEGSSQSGSCGTLTSIDESLVTISSGQPMGSDENFNGATHTPADTEEDIELVALDNLMAQMDWNYEAQSSNSAQSILDDSIFVGEDEILSREKYVQSLKSRTSATPAIGYPTEPKLNYLHGQMTGLAGEVMLINNISRLDIRGDGEVTRLGAGESYRPNHNRRSPPRADTFRSDRDRDRSPRRDRRTPPLASDSYHPGGRDRSPRRRSRTPPYRARDRSPPRDMTWRGRPRSPPRGARTPLRARSPRRFSPRRDDDRRERPRSPRRDERRRSRSPFDRNRTPLRARSPIRARSPLPRRSPPPGPRGSWRPRSRSRDPRDIRTPLGPSSQSWRRRSPSPLRRRSPSPIRRRSPSPALRDSERSSGRSSGTNSRRSSPPVHPSRQALTQAATREAIRSPVPIRDRSPLGLAYRQRELESARSTPKDRSPIRPTAPRSPPRGPAATFRGTEVTFRAPTGPSGGRTFTAPVPSGPSSSYNSRSGSESTGPIAPPSGPRGYAPPRGPSASMRGGRSSFSIDRYSRPDTSSWGAAPLARPNAELSSRTSLPPPRPPPSVSPSPARDTPPAAPTNPSGIPTGPRAGTTIPSRPSLQHSSSIYHSRGSISGPSSGLRIHPAMVGIPPIIPGGRIDPTASGIPTDLAARLRKKEDEAEVLREELKQRQEKLRNGLKHWDRLSRESASMGLKSELSERHLRVLAGEGVGGKAF
ncbi:hypothetical protein SBOR_9227 [Sclerotinia borealis F-4128]|uniref:Uncharacterized protein n=1 Tax=Sclerotinia borealis (strain F-4128) TaxID=1432307 RepID=W9C3F0_SCLBF|nr:hypothetical protein SBOR_9227 [Sclerotinia borealis F-4128]